MKFKPARVIIKKDDDKFGSVYRAKAWERNSIVWGRPFAGMACTDIQTVLDGIGSRPDADMSKVQVISSGSGALGIAVVFAAALDSVTFRGFVYGIRATGA